MKSQLTLRQSVVIHARFRIRAFVSTILLASSLVCLPYQATAETMPLIRLAYGNKIQYAPQIVAVRMKMFEPQGLSVQPLILATGPQAAEALITGAADAAAMGDAPAVFASASGQGLKIISAYGTSEHMHRIVAAAKSGVHGPKDLVGKRVAIQFGTSTYGAFLLFCQKHGISKTDLNLIHLNPTDMPAAMQSSQIDAAVGSEPWPSNIEETVPGSYPVTSLSGLGNQYPHVMVVSRKLATQSPAAVQALLQGLNQAIDMINREPDKAAAVISAATGVPVERERKNLGTIEWKLRLDAPIQDSLAQTADMLKEQNKLPAEADIRAALDTTFVDRMP